MIPRSCLPMNAGAPKLRSTRKMTHPGLGIDYGDSRIGIAATDDFGIMAHPVSTIQMTALDPVQEIKNIAVKRSIKTIVIGLPLLLDGSEGDSVKKVRKFSEKIAAVMPDIPMFFVDETYTTVDASDKLRAAGKKARQQKELIDQAAAVEILNRWMEEIS